MTISVEPMAKVVIEKREIPVKGQKEPFVRPWTSYTAALFATMEGNDEGIDQVSASIAYTCAHHANAPFSYGLCW